MFIQIRYKTKKEYKTIIANIVKQMYNVDLKDVIFLDGNMSNLKYKNVYIKRRVR
jgi:hypothetical protein